MKTFTLDMRAKFRDFFFLNCVYFLYVKTLSTHTASEKKQEEEEDEKKVHGEK